MSNQGFNMNVQMASAFNSEQVMKVIGNIEKDLQQSPTLILPDLKVDETAIIIIDMINGFALEGSLASGRVEALVEPIAALMKASKGMNKVFVCDRHPENAVEFSSYLPHAIQGTNEALIVEPLYALQDEHTSVIFKNSTNGMMTKAMRQYLEANSSISNFVIVGDCTDICVLQFALSLKAYFNEMNIEKSVMVPMALVDTFDLEVTSHDAALMNLFAFYNMKMNGVSLYSNIQY